MMPRTQTSMRLTEKTLLQLRYLKFIRSESTAKVLAYVLNKYFEEKNLKIPKHFPNADCNQDWLRMNMSLLQDKND